MLILAFEVSNHATILSYIFCIFFLILECCAFVLIAPQKQQQDRVQLIIGFSLQFIIIHRSRARVCHYNKAGNLHIWKYIHMTFDFIRGSRGIMFGQVRLMRFRKPKDDIETNLMFRLLVGQQLGSAVTQVYFRMQVHYIVHLFHFNSIRS